MIHPTSPSPRRSIAYLDSLRTLFVTVDLETARKLRSVPIAKIFKKEFDEITRFNIPFRLMPNEPALDKAVLSFQIPLTVLARLDKDAAARKMNRSEYVLHQINQGIREVSLTPEDYEEIARHIRRNQEKREKKRRG